MVPWELRYRSPRAIDDVLIETFTDQEAEAKELADRHLATLASPSVRFVRLRPHVAARSTEYPELVAKWGNGARPTPSTPPVDEDHDEPDRVPPRSGELVPPARAARAARPDGVDDQMSGPRVARPARPPRSSPARRVGT
jgi:hypothetical protein